MPVGSLRRPRLTMCPQSSTPSKPRSVRARAWTPSWSTKFITGDLLAERRWPQFSLRAHQETGVTSILSIRLFVQHDTMGALNLYSTQPDAFDATDVAWRRCSPPTP